jgi:hypothetical protein
MLYQGKWDDAEKFQSPATEVNKRVLGAEHPSTLTSMSNLAYMWKGQDRREEAVVLIRECLQLRERVLGTEHPSTLSSRMILTKWEMEDLGLESSSV